MPFLNLEYEFSSFVYIIVCFIPACRGCEPWTWDVRDWTQKETVEDKTE